MTEQSNNLKAAAEGYLNQGLSIVLMTVKEDGKKGTLHTWKQWETRRQTREEFDALPWLNAERFAVVCGVQGINGLFFTPIDTDNPDFDLNLLRVTQTERTPKGGHHFIYWSRVNARGKKLHDLKIELLGQGNLCLMCPSKDYVKVNDNPPTEIDDIKEVFESLAEKLGGHTKPRPQNNRIRFCCREALTKDNHIGHLMRLAIASEYKRAGYPNEDIVQLFKSQDDYDHDKCLVQVESADPLKAARPETIREYGYCYPECQEDCIETRNRAFQTKQELMEKLAAQSGPISLEELTEILGSTIRHDDTTKNLAFLAMLLTYTEEDQINIGFLAESSTGKSYIPLELAALFPEEDVMKLGYASPQAFFYESGVLIPDPSDKRDVEEKERRKIRVVDLHKKILIFLDQPHDQLLQRLRSLLSHDEKQIVSKIVNKREKSGNRTETVIIKGYPTVLFCTAKLIMQDQEKTRLLLLSPEICQAKLEETIALKIQKESDREGYKKKVDEDQKRINLQARIWAIKRSEITDVKIPVEYREKIYQRFMDDHKKLIPRNQRDITRLLAVMKGLAILNFAYRQRVENFIFINEEDIITGFKLYYEISQANEIGIPPEIFNIYQKLKPTFAAKENGITRKDFQAWYFKTFYKIIGREGATEILKILETTGLLIEQPDPIDKRVIRFVLPECVSNDTASSFTNEEEEKQCVAALGGRKPDENMCVAALGGKQVDEIHGKNPPVGSEPTLFWSGDPPTPATHCFQGLSVQEVLEKARTQLQNAFMDGDLVNEMVRLGLSLDEAKHLVEQLKVASEIGMDDLGLWHWLSKGGC